MNENMPEKPEAIILIVPTGTDPAKALAAVGAAFDGTEVVYRWGDAWDVEFNDAFEGCPWWHVRPVARKVLHVARAA